MRKIKLVFALLISVLVISTCFTTLAFAEENDTTYIKEVAEENNLATNKHYYLN